MLKETLEDFEVENNIRKHRELLGLSQREVVLHVKLLLQELQCETKISFEEYEALEDGDLSVSLEVCYALSIVLQTSVDQLFGIEKDMKEVYKNTVNVVMDDIDNEEVLGFLQKVALKILSDYKTGKSLRI
ncbi:hypothetical protein GIX45_17505 [Erwinia sp. CPCC 100877]|nr:hypothetical protein [Erwinia sp. CPCC 100877]